jgi:hypothetical protein
MLITLHVLLGSQNTHYLLPFRPLTDWFFFKPKWTVFTARYGLSPYITLIRFVHKGLLHFPPKI